MNMKRTTQYTIITGASGGIGLALAHEFAKNGHNLILVARRQDELKKQMAKLTLKYQVSVDYITADITNEKDVNATMEYISKKEYEINVLINNAGFGSLGEFAELDKKLQLDMINLNITALVNLTHIFSNIFVKNGGGYILNVSSIAGFLPGPMMSVYYATKNFVTSFSLGIRKELEPKHVKVSVLCPGYTKTGFQEVSGMKGLKLLKANQMMMTAEQVAIIAYDKFITHNKAVIIPGFMNKVMRVCVKLMPTAITVKLINYIQSNK
jgi:uncharacterized protein